MSLFHMRLKKRSCKQWITEQCEVCYDNNLNLLKIDCESGQAHLKIDKHQLIELEKYLNDNRNRNAEKEN